MFQNENIKKTVYYLLRVRGEGGRSCLLAGSGAFHKELYHTQGIGICGMRAVTIIQSLLQVSGEGTYERGMCTVEVRGERALASLYATPECTAKSERCGYELSAYLRGGIGKVRPAFFYNMAFRLTQKVHEICLPEGIERLFVSIYSMYGRCGVHGIERKQSPDIASRMEQHLARKMHTAQCLLWFCEYGTDKRGNACRNKAPVT